MSEAPEIWGGGPGSLPSVASYSKPQSGTCLGLLTSVWSGRWSWETEPLTCRTQPGSVKVEVNSHVQELFVGVWKPQHPRHCWNFDPRTHQLWRLLLRICSLLHNETHHENLTPWASNWVIPKVISILFLHIYSFFIYNVRPYIYNK